MNVTPKQRCKMEEPSVPSSTTAAAEPAAHKPSTNVANTLPKAPRARKRTKAGKRRWYLRRPPVRRRRRLPTVVHAPSPRAPSGVVTKAVSVHCCDAHIYVQLEPLLQAFSRQTSPTTICRLGLNW